MKPIYTYDEAVHNLKAPREVVPIIVDLLKPQSVLDVGCGIGTWLAAFDELGVSDCIGVDGDHVDPAILTIAEEKFCPRNLQNPFSLGRKFDLVLSLEVAEHLDEKYADVFVETLTNHGDNIVFSAAVPGQGGQNHLNEQWPPYWQEKFLKRGFYFHDCIRPVIWDNSKVDWWYRQNIFLVTKNKPESLPFNSLSIVHPVLFLIQKENEKEFYSSLLEGKQGLRIAFKILLIVLYSKYAIFLHFLAYFTDGWHFHNCLLL